MTLQVHNGSYSQWTYQTSTSIRTRRDRFVSTIHSHTLLKVWLVWLSGHKRHADIAAFEWWFSATILTLSNETLLCRLFIIYNCTNQRLVDDHNVYTFSHQHAPPSLPLPQSLPPPSPTKSQNFLAKDLYIFTRINTWTHQCLNTAQSHCFAASPKKHKC